MKIEELKPGVWVQDDNDQDHSVGYVRRRLDLKNGQVELQLVWNDGTPRVIDYQFQPDGIVVNWSLLIWPDEVLTSGNPHRAEHELGRKVRANLRQRIDLCRALTKGVDLYEKVGFPKDAEPTALATRLATAFNRRMQSNLDELDEMIAEAIYDLSRDL